MCSSDLALDEVESRLEFLWLPAWFSSEHTKRVTTRTDDRHRVTGRSFPAWSPTITGAAAGEAVPRRRLSLVARALLAGFVDLSRPVDSVLDAFPDEIEAALESGFYLSNRGVSGIVDGVEQLSDLVDAEERVGVEDERDTDLAGSERTSFEGSVTRVREDIAAVGTPNAGTAVPGLDSSFATLRAGSLFPGLFAAPLDLRIERLWPQH